MITFCCLTLLAVAPDPNAASIEAIKTAFARIRAAIDAGRLVHKEREFEYCDEHFPNRVDAYYDKETLVMLSETHTSADDFYDRFDLYLKEGRVFFVLEQLSLNGKLTETRSYLKDGVLLRQRITEPYDKKGKRVSAKKALRFEESPKKPEPSFGELRGQIEQLLQSTARCEQPVDP